MDPYQGMFPYEGRYLCMGQRKNVSVGENEGFLWGREGMNYYEGMFPNEGNLCMGQGRNASVGENEGFSWGRKGSIFS